MTNSNGWNTPASAPIYAALGRLPRAALAGVRTRRMVAVIFDLMFISIICFAVWLVAGLLSFGLLWFVIPPLFPIIAFFYNGATLSGPGMGTWGMRMLGIEVRSTDGRRASFLQAAAHAVMFYLTWMFPVLFLVSLFEDNKRCLHDMLAGVVVTRRG
jgi:uncharacterized RDD family membrane protein YckC